MSKEAISASKPHQTVLVSMRGEFSVMGKTREVDNLITIDWHMPASFDPAMYVISVGKTRFSLSLLKKSRAFAVNFMGYDYKKEILYCGSQSGMNVDKFKETGLTKVDCETIECSYVKEASAVLECEVVDEIGAGDHILFLAKILQYRNLKDDKRLLHMGGAEFTTTIR